MNCERCEHLVLVKAQEGFGFRACFCPPYKGKYIGKNLTTGNIETFENKTYDKGGWNQHDIRWWLDVELPKEIEL